ncbi:MAG: hypothetical protein HY744_33760 [Deltaproteobacteria bacterium]|nr:hypothetical protein [Deltaproteobacteria bacterium]
MKRSALPLRFDKASWSRMLTDARRFGWKWVVVSVAPEGEITALDPARARRGREWCLGPDAAIANITAWVLA